MIEVRTTQELPDDLHALTCEIMQHVAGFYRSGEPGRERVYLVMNALAIVAATVIASTDESVLDFFNDAVDANVASLQRGEATTQ